MRQIYAGIRKASFMRYLEDGLSKVAAHRSKATLGDRTKYIGASDITVAFECMRKAVLDKLRPKQRESPKKLWMFERGHSQEESLLRAFRANGSVVLHQVEIGFSANGIPYRIHPDLILVSKDRTILLESKSMGRPPEYYERFERQINLQAESLYRLWDQKAFRLSQNENFVTFPELVSRVTRQSVDLKKEIEGWVVCIGKDIIDLFGPATISDEMFWKESLFLGQKVWEQMTSPDDLPFIRGLSPICEYCDQMATCPKFDATYAEDFAPAIKQLLDIKRKLKDLKQQEEALGAQLESAYEAMTPTLLSNNSYIGTSQGTLAYLPNPRRTISIDRLTTALKRVNLPKKLQEQVITEATNTSTSKRIHLLPPKNGAANQLLLP